MRLRAIFERFIITNCDVRGPYVPKFLPDPSDPCRYFIRSKSFLAQFPSVTEVELFCIIQSYCGRSRGGPLGQSEAILGDDRGGHHVFGFETFSNTHEALTFGVWRHAKPSTIHVL